MSDPLDVLTAPCGSCPYVRTTPPGVWDASEYEKLRHYADGSALAVFLCHQTNAHGTPTICRGWLTVERESVAVRLALCRRQVTPEQVRAAPLVPLYSTGEAAAEAGLAGVKRPGVRARRLMRRLVRKGAARRL